MSRQEAQEWCAQLEVALPFPTRRPTGIEQREGASNSKHGNQVALALTANTTTASLAIRGTTMTTYWSSTALSTRYGPDSVTGC